MAPKRIDPVPKRIDPVDHFAYTLEDLQWWYGAHYTTEEIVEYDEHTCRPAPGSRRPAVESFPKHIEADTSLRDAYQLHLKREWRRWEDRLVDQQRRQRDLLPRASAMV